MNTPGLPGRERAAGLVRRPAMRTAATAAAALAAISVAANASAAGDPPSGPDLPTPYDACSPLRPGHADALLETPALARTWDARLVDLNGDGRLQALFAVASSDLSGGLVVAGINGSRFGLPSEVPGVPGTTDLQLADLDGDGDLDILASDRYAHLLTAVRNDGAGGLHPVWSHPMPGLQVDLLVRPDGTRVLVVPLDFTGDGVEMLELDAAGFPVRSTDFQPFPEAWRVTHAKVADVDGDGLDDLVAGRNSAYVFRARPDGSFEEPEWVLGGVIPWTPLAAADIDGDGRSEIMIARSGADIAGDARVLIQRRADSGVWSTLALLPAIADGRPRRSTMADMDGDGIDDLLVGLRRDNGLLGAVEVHRSLGDGTFEPWHVLEAPGGMAFAAGDTDGDGRADVLAAPFGSGGPLRVAVLTRCAPDGRPGMQRRIETGGQPVGRLRLADGGPDRIVTLDDGAESVSLNVWDATELVPVATIAFDGAAVHRVAMTTPATARGTEPGAWNIAVRVEDGRGIRSVRLVRGDRTGLQEVAAVDIDADEWPARSGDVDGDGVADLVTTTPSGTRLRWLGPAGAPDPVDFENVRRPSLADLDRDGHLDLIGTAFPEGGWNGPLTVAWGDAGAGLRPPVEYPHARIWFVHRPVDRGPDLDPLVAGASETQELTLFRVTPGRRIVATDVTLPDDVGGWPLWFTVLHAGTGNAEIFLPGNSTGHRRVMVLDDGPEDLRIRVALTPWWDSTYSTPLIADLDGDGLDDLLFESGSTYLAAACGSTCPGDVDADGHVDFEDLLALIVPIDPALGRAWGLMDLDDDGDRDVQDVVALLGHWGPCAE